MIRKKDKIRELLNELNSQTMEANDTRFITCLLLPPEQSMILSNSKLLLPTCHLTYRSCCWEKVRMVAALLQVHHDVEQRHLRRTATSIQRLKVTRQDVLVVLPVNTQE